MMNKLYGIKDTIKPIRCILGKKIINPQFYVYCFINGLHSKSLCNNVSISFEQKLSVERDFKVGRESKGIS